MTGHHRRGFIQGASAAGLLAPFSHAGAIQASPWKRPVIFSEDFNRLDVSPWGPGSRWIAHTPWNGDFGDAAFADPEPSFPFTIGNAVLRIEARKSANGRWRSGLLSSLDTQGAGFATLYGYFEARLKVPIGPGVWPAFWLVSAKAPGDRVEIDVMEYYGKNPRRFSSAVHIWPQETGKKAKSSQLVWTRSKEPLYEQFHTFGVDVAPSGIDFYLDRRLVQQLPCPAEHRTPLGILVNLALGSGWPIKNTPSPSHLLVDYIRVHASGSS